jgi:hypothetical protein
MRLSVLLLSVLLSVAMTGAGSAQATLPNDDVNIANNPGSVKADPPARVEALDCSCRNPAPDPAAPAGPKGAAGPSDEIIDCSCRKSVPDTTGTVAGPDAAAPPR